MWHRAKAAAQRVGNDLDVAGVPAGTYVAVHVASVPVDAARGVLDRVEAFLQVFTPARTTQAVHDYAWLGFQEHIVLQHLHM